MNSLKAVVLDWAGTVVDTGSRAPMGVFVEVFSRFGVEITIAEARGPMGMAKLEHIRALGALPRIAAAWAAQHGRPFTEADAQAIYDIFVPMNVAVVSKPEHSNLIPGAAAMATALRGRGMKIGSTTGYTREIMAPLLPLAAAQGYAPDNLVCAGDLAVGRPTAMMMYRCFLDLGVHPASSVVKVDDTPAGIGEGIAAGCWTVGVTLSGNEVGLSAEELARTPTPELNRLRSIAEARLYAAGAHICIDSVADIMPVLDQFAARLARGERP